MKHKHTKLDSNEKLAGKLIKDKTNTLTHDRGARFMYKVNLKIEKPCVSEKIFQCDNVEL